MRNNSKTIHSEEKHLQKVLADVPKVPARRKSEILHGIVPELQRHNAYLRYALLSVLVVIGFGLSLVHGAPQEFVREVTQTKKDSTVPGMMNADEGELLPAHEQSGSRDATKSVDDSSKTGNDDVDSNDDRTPKPDSNDSDDSTETEKPEDNKTQDEHNASRDRCRAELDARKRAGEKIDSDLYKECDKL